MRSFLYVIVLFALFSCKEEEKVPEYVMSEERFTEVLTEFQLAEATIRLGYHRTPDSLNYNDSVYSSVFRKLKITQADFDTNYAYYSNSPEQLKKIYEQVITNLSTRSAMLIGKKDEVEGKDDPAITE